MDSDKNTNYLVRTPSDNSLFSVAGGVTPGIIDGLGPLYNAISSELGHDHETFAVLHSSCADTLDSVSHDGTDSTGIALSAASS